MYFTKGHAKFRILYHIIFVVKYRQPLLVHAGEDIKGQLEEIAKRIDSRFSIEAMEVDRAHIHLMVHADPSVAPVQIVRRLKQESTVFIWKKHEELLSRHFWNARTFWTDGYFISSIGDVSEQTLRQYIDSQG